MYTKTRYILYLSALIFPALVSSTVVASDGGAVDQLTSIEWKETLEAIIDVIVFILEKAAQGIQEGADMLTSEESTGSER